MPIGTILVVVFVCLEYGVSVLGSPVRSAKEKAKKIAVDSKAEGDQLSPVRSAKKNAKKIAVDSKAEGDPQPKARQAAIYDQSKIAIIVSASGSLVDVQDRTGKLQAVVAKASGAGRQVAQPLPASVDAPAVQPLLPHQLASGPRPPEASVDAPAVQPLPPQQLANVPMPLEASVDATAVQPLPPQQLASVPMPVEASVEALAAQPLLPQQLVNGSAENLEEIFDAQSQAYPPAQDVGTIGKHTHVRHRISKHALFLMICASGCAAIYVMWKYLLQKRYSEMLRLAANRQEDEEGNRTKSSASSPPKWVFSNKKPEWFQAKNQIDNSSLKDALLEKAAEKAIDVSFSDQEWIAGDWAGSEGNSKAIRSGSYIILGRCVAVSEARSPHFNTWTFRAKAKAEAFDSKNKLDNAKLQQAVLEKAALRVATFAFSKEAREVTFTAEDWAGGDWTGIRPGNVVVFEKCVAVAEATWAEFLDQAIDPALLNSSIFRSSLTGPPKKRLGS